MTSRELERKFAGRGPERGGILMLRPADALALVRRARAERVPVLGVDAFDLGPAATRPLSEHTLDFSGASCRTNPWSEAEAFLEERAESDMHFEVVLGDAP